MSKSIWDTRFSTSKSVTFDEALKISGLALDDWITMKGSHVLVGEGGEILAGLGGNFKNLSDVPRNTIKQREGESDRAFQKRAKKELGITSKKSKTTTEKKQKTEIKIKRDSFIEKAFGGEPEKAYLNDGSKSKGPEVLTYYDPSKPVYTQYELSELPGATNSGHSRITKLEGYEGEGQFKFPKKEFNNDQEKIDYIKHVLCPAIGIHSLAEVKDRLFDLAYVNEGRKTADEAYNNALKRIEELNGYSRNYMKHLKEHEKEYESQPAWAYERRPKPAGIELNVDRFKNSKK